MPIRYEQDQLYMDEVAISQIVQAYGTPSYIYSQNMLRERWLEFHVGMGNHPHLICYAVKANSNIAVLQTLSQLGSGFDIVSGGELQRVLKAGASAKNIVFSGVGKSMEELALGLTHNIKSFNIESKEELLRLNNLALEMGKKASIAIRVNPHIEADTHPYITTGKEGNKFGIDFYDAVQLYQQAAQLPGIDIQGIVFHLGSQLTDITPYLHGMNRILDLIRELAALNIDLQFISVGGGFGISYQHESVPSPKEFAQTIQKHLQDFPHLTILLEPGRSIAAPAGILVTRINHIKPTKNINFAIVDAGMNDLIRPALYNAWHEVLPLTKRDQPPLTLDIVGPLCESGDFLAKERTLSVSAGDDLAFLNAGAYGMVMSSNYNSRPRAAEIMVVKNQTYLIRERETFDDLIRLEHLVS